MPRWGGPSAPAPRHGTEAAARSAHSQARTQHRTPPRPWSSVSPHAHPRCLQAAPSSTSLNSHVNDVSLPALLTLAQRLGEAAWPRFHTQVLLLAICTRDCPRVWEQILQERPRLGSDGSRRPCLGSAARCWPPCPIPSPAASSSLHSLVPRAGASITSRGQGHPSPRSSYPSAATSPQPGRSFCPIPPVTGR